MRTITLSITNFNRYEFLIDSFHQVLEDDRISEIIISDDASDPEIFQKVKAYCDQHKKIKLYQNAINQDCYKNKHISVWLSTNPWLILFDSDNVIDKINYLDRIFSIPEWNPTTLYQPCHAAPQFDFRQYAGLVVDRTNVSEYMDNTMFSTALNAMNYFVNRDEYLRVWDGNVNPHTADSIYQNYRWLDAGNKIHFLEGLEYFHRVHGESHYKNNNHKTGNFYQIIENRLKQMQ